MLKSMTGFGKTALITDKHTIVVVVSSLNAKSFDLNIALPASFSEKEPDIRSRIADKLQRGKVRVNIDYHNSTDDKKTWHYDEHAFVACYTQLKKLADRVMAPYDQLFSLALNAPGVILEHKNNSTDQAIWQQLEKHVLDAVDRCDQFRITEGRIIHKNLHAYSKAIGEQLANIVSLEPERVKKMRDTIRAQVQTGLHHVEIDTGRMEQEFLFYMTRMAIDEELVRLQSHLAFFNSVLDYPTSSGKKLSFIVQEIGRETNTIGAKANDIAVQRCVIAMKEELGKIKEQLHNVV